eukprot:358262-Chlamydomonas_euryale.AAC.6
MLLLPLPPPLLPLRPARGCGAMRWLTDSAAVIARTAPGPPPPALATAACEPQRTARAASAALPCAASAALPCTTPCAMPCVASAALSCTKPAALPCMLACVVHAREASPVQAPCADPRAALCGRPRAPSAPCAARCVPPRPCRPISPRPLRPLAIDGASRDAAAAAAAAAAAEAAAKEAAADAAAALATWVSAVAGAREGFFTSLVFRPPRRTLSTRLPPPPRPSLLLKLLVLAPSLPSSTRKPCVSAWCAWRSDRRANVRPHSMHSSGIGPHRAASSAPQPFGAPPPAPSRPRCASASGRTLGVQRLSSVDATQRDAGRRERMAGQGEKRPGMQRVKWGATGPLQK